MEQEERREGLGGRYYGMCSSAVAFFTNGALKAPTPPA